MHIWYNDGKYNCEMTYRLIYGFKPFDKTLGAYNNETIKRAKSRAIRMIEPKIEVLCQVYSQILDTGIIAKRNNLMLDVSLSPKKNNIYHNTYKAITNAIDDALEDTEAECIPVSIYIDYYTGDWAIYVYDELTDMYRSAKKEAKHMDYLPMMFEGERLYVKSFNLVAMELGVGARDVSDKSMHMEIAKASMDAFTDVVKRKGSNPDNLDGIQMILHIFYSPECNNWGLGRNIIFSMANSPRSDDKWYNGHSCIAEAVKKCHETKVMAFPAIIFVSPWGYDFYINGKPCCHGIPSLLPKLNPEKPSEDDVLRNSEEDTPFYLLKNSERAYQCSDFIINANTQDIRMKVRNRFENLMEEARFNLMIPKDRSIVGVLTTYTNEFAESKPDYRSIEEYAIAFIVYLLNYNDSHSFNQEVLKKIIHKNMDNYPDIPEHYVFLDIINPYTMALTYNGDILTVMSAPENWYELLMDIENDDNGDDDEADKFNLY